MSILTKELMVATCVNQSSNELSTSVSDSVKCIQKEINTYTLNSLACAGAADGCGVMLSDRHIVSQVSIPAWSIFSV